MMMMKMMVMMMIAMNRKPNPRHDLVRGLTVTTSRQKISEPTGV